MSDNEFELHSEVIDLFFQAATEPDRKSIDRSAAFVSTVVLFLEASEEICENLDSVKHRLSSGELESGELREALKDCVALALACGSLSKQLRSGEPLDLEEDNGGPDKVHNMRT